MMQFWGFMAVLWQLNCAHFTPGSNLEINTFELLPRCTGQHHIHRGRQHLPRSWALEDSDSIRTRKAFHQDAQLESSLCHDFFGTVSYKKTAYRKQSIPQQSKAIETENATWASWTMDEKGPPLSTHEWSNQQTADPLEVAHRWWQGWVWNQPASELSCHQSVKHKMFHWVSNKDRVSVPTVFWQLMSWDLSSEQCGPRQLVETINSSTFTRNWKKKWSHQLSTKRCNDYLHRRRTRCHGARPSD